MSSTHTDDDATPGPWWGTAAAATQCEGAAPGADWAGWEAEGRAPASRDGNGFRTRYADDLALLAEHGITHHRLTVEWARLEPRSGRWDADEVAHLRRVLEAARGVGVEMWACLLHGSAPGWFTDDERGWLGDRAVLTWARHVDRVAEAVGDLVAGWVPIHEPEVVARLGYGDGTFPPGRHDPDDHRDARAALLAAEAEAARLLRSGPAPVGVTARPGTPEDEHDLLVVNAAVDRVEAPLEGAIEATPGTRLLVVTGDPDTGSGGGRGGTSAGGDEREPDDRRSEGSGPGGQAADEPRAVDAARAERLARAVQTITDAAAGSAGIVGTFVQPAIDGYEWHRGFEARLGLFDRDRNPRPALAALPVAGPRAEAPPSPAG